MHVCAAVPRAPQKINAAHGKTVLPRDAAPTTRLPSVTQRYSLGTRVRSLRRQIVDSTPDARPVVERLSGSPQTRMTDSSRDWVEARRITRLRGNPLTPHCTAVADPTESTAEHRSNHEMDLAHRSPRHLHAGWKWYVYGSAGFVDRAADGQSNSNQQAAGVRLCEGPFGFSISNSRTSSRERW